MATATRIKIGAFASMERITRPSLAEQVLQRIQDSRPIEDDSGPADLRWGKPSDIDLTIGQLWGMRRLTTRTIRSQEDQEQTEDPIQRIVHQYEEVDRLVEEIRIENPDDSEDYVIVERITAIMFRGPDDPDGNEVYVQFNLDHGG